MPTNININYVNASADKNHPQVFVFTSNVATTFDNLTDNIAWRVMTNIGRGSSCNFVYPIDTEVRAAWGSDRNCFTAQIQSDIGARYSVVEDATGIILEQTGEATQQKAIEIVNDIQVPGGIAAQLYKDGKLLMTKNEVAYNQKATFVLKPTLYWGLASEIVEGQVVNSAVLNVDHFEKQDLEGVFNSTVTLVGNAQDGYFFEFS